MSDEDVEAAIKKRLSKGYPGPRATAFGQAKDDVAALLAEAANWESAVNGFCAALDKIGAARDRYRRALEEIRDRPCSGVGSPPSCDCRTCIAARALKEPTP